jgi:hypothetical protein
MDYLPGGTLKARLDAAVAADTKIPPALMRRWAEWLIDGMEAVNAKMLHRDLKPDNILMDGDMPKIADFGLSKLVGAATRSITFKGGQHMLYMAPEGWKLEKNKIQIDMYALGIVLYEIAALKFPYNVPADANQLRDMHLFEHAAPLAPLRPDLPTGFCHVITKMMEKRPQDRFAKWADVKDAVERAFDPAGASAATPTVVSSMVSTIGVMHDMHSRRRLEEEAREQERQEWRKLNEFQAKKLIEELKAAVEALHKSSPLAHIEIRDCGGRTEFLLPFGSLLSVKFFEVEPAMKLKRGLVHYAALVSDQDRAGLNFLLCRGGDTDLYGRWVPLRATISVIVDPRRMAPRPEPFGFEQGEMKDVAVADFAMHVFVMDYPEVSAGEAFLQAAHRTMQRHDPAAQRCRR